MIIHLEKEQLKQARRDLLRDDVYIIFVDALRLYHQEGYTTLAPAELYLSAKYFVGDVLQLPDIIEGIADEMDDIMDEADNKDEAMLIMMVATGVFCAVGKKYKGGVMLMLSSGLFMTAGLTIHSFFRCSISVLKRNRRNG